MKIDTRRKIEELFELYPWRRGALLPAIYLVQEERGFVDRESAKELAELFEIAPVEVWEVLTFYNMFYTEAQPRHHVYVCTNLSCSLRGARTLLHGLEKHLGVPCGTPTDDGRVVLGHGDLAERRDRPNPPRACATRLDRLRTARLRRFGDRDARLVRPAELVGGASPRLD